MSANLKKIIFGICCLISLCAIFLNPINTGNNITVLSEIAMNIDNFLKFVGLNYKIDNLDIISINLFLEYFFFGMFLNLFIRSMENIYKNTNLVSIAFGLLFIVFKSYIEVLCGKNILIYSIVIRFSDFFLGLLLVIIFSKLFGKCSKKNKYKIKV